MNIRVSLALLAAVVLAPTAGAQSSRTSGECGLPDAAPIWIDYGESSVKADTRAVFARPGTVMATSGTAVPAAFRQAGAATTYFELHLPNLVGDTSSAADPATVVPAADALYDKAVKTTACATPWIALNELQGANLPAPWKPANAQYRANVLTVVQRLAERGAHPALLVHGDPTIAGDTAAWWRQVSQSATLVYEAYYDASKMYPLGPLMASRRMRLGMRFTTNLFQTAGVPRSRIGFMLGFHSAQTPGIGGRQGLEPTEAWLRVVKWEALAAKQVATEYQLPTLWSWGWGTFGPDSADDDKPVAACTWLWARDQTLCNAPSVAGPSFDTSLVEGQIVQPANVTCTFADGSVYAGAVDRLARLTKDRHVALTAQFARAAMMNAAHVGERQVLAVEQKAIAVAFKGNRKAYVRALARRGADVEVARGVIADELRRRALPFDQITAREAAAVNTAICLHDDLPGVGVPLSVGNQRDIGVVPLASFLPFLFRDKTAPAAPATPVATRTGANVTLTWATGSEPDLAGYDVYRTTPGGTPQKLDVFGLAVASYVDAGSPVGSTYTIEAVDTSGNHSGASAAVTADQATR